MDLSNCTIDYIKTCNNDNIGIKSAYLYFEWFPLFFNVFINIHEYAKLCKYDDLHFWPWNKSPMS